ncbi:DUF4138 domain-containing protein [Pedobacter sp. Leaf132]|uniref:DUF4138 domain-containing protein n=1 Tax=Pedobacter sp. Leaf132 TaxID=2876557 RepID=UPI001E308E6E|nr:DUF4138 domain-containing protein [Pedobacter sp. Leaf132]
MKRYLNFALCSLLFYFSPLYSYATELPVIYMSLESTLHFRSPEPISYVDLPKSKLRGDLPLKNLLRIRLQESFSATNITAGSSIGVITITGEQFFAQYRIVLVEQGLMKADDEVEILPIHMLPLIPSQPSLSTPQMHAKSVALISLREKKPMALSKQRGIGIKLNQIRCAGDLIFLDLSFSNDSELGYEIEELKFSIVDKKINKATNAQQFDLKPKFSLSNLQTFIHQARNIYVLPKASFSPAKRLRITLAERQPSSRTVVLELSYGELLRADGF